MPLLLTIVSVCALGGVLVATALGSDRARYAFKPMASLAFIGVAVVGGALSSSASPYATWIVIGLVLGAIGDVALMLPGRRPFMVGLVSFLLGHVAYVIGFHCVVPVSTWFVPLSLLPAVSIVPILVWLWPHLGSMKIPVLAYVMVISTMVVGALAVLTADEPGGLNTLEVRLLASGAVLFFLSDLAVARQRFVRQSLVNRLWGLPAYYAGQLLLAWSALLFSSRVG